MSLLPWKSGEHEERRLLIEKIMLDLSKVYAVIRYYNFLITGHLHALQGISI
jgi:hypothetical protein